MDYISLRRFKKYWLALRADNKVMIAKEAGSAILDSYEVAVVNSNNILGARYDSCRSWQGKAHRAFCPTWLVLPCCQTVTISDWSSFQEVFFLPKTKKGFRTHRLPRGTGMRLALSLRWRFLNLDLRANWFATLLDRTSGRSSLTRISMATPGFADFVEKIPRLLLRRLRTKLDHVKDTWAKTCKEQEEIWLSVLLTLRPEIIETGLAKDGNDRRLVALYPFSDSERV